jgi:hypothetical protein
MRQERLIDDLDCDAIRGWADRSSWLAIDLHWILGRMLSI